MSTYLTVEEVANRLSVSRAMVDRLIGDGVLCAVDLNAGRNLRQRKLRIRESDLETFIQRGTVAPKARQSPRRRRSPQQPTEKEYV